MEENLKTPEKIETAQDLGEAVKASEESEVKITERKPSIFEKIKKLIGTVVASIKKMLAERKAKKETSTNGTISLSKDEISTDSTLNEPLPEIYLPETTEDLVWALRKVPEDVLSTRDREKIMFAMTFSTRRVRDIMLPYERIVFLHENDFMGPLTLDKLYKSGYSHFPVLSTNGGVAGVVNAETLMSLEVKETDRASTYVDPNVFYLRDSYTLPQALAAFLRTNSYFFMVVNSDGKTVGLLTLKMLLSRLVTDPLEDDFTRDDDAFAVAKR